LNHRCHLHDMVQGRSSEHPQHLDSVVMGCNMAAHTEFLICLLSQNPRKCQGRDSGCQLLLSRTARQKKQVYQLPHVYHFQEQFVVVRDPAWREFRYCVTQTPISNDGMKPSSFHLTWELISEPCSMNQFCNFLSILRCMCCDTFIF